MQNTFVLAMERGAGNIQDRYTGDVGDFGKYGLLKALCGTDLILGLVWYLVPDEVHNDDGKHISYLLKGNRGMYRPCDKDLYDQLAVIVGGGQRSINTIQNSKILPKSTIYHDFPLIYDDIPSVGGKGKEKRLSRRKQWFEKALDATSGCDIVFLDPDNGLEIESVQAHHNKAPKYVFLDELVKFTDRGQSVVLYQHLCRRGQAKSQIQKRMAQIRKITGGGIEPWALRFRRGSGRAFLIIPSNILRDKLLNRSRAFLKTPWSDHFNVLGIDQ